MGWVLLEVRAALRGGGKATQPDAMAAAGVLSKNAAAVATYPKDAPSVLGPATTPTTSTAVGISA